MADKKSKKDEKKQKQQKEEKDNKQLESLGMTIKKSVNFHEWYAQLITYSELIEYYDISGCYILRPHAYAIWEFIQEKFNTAIKKLRVKNCYFPIFVTKQALQTEQSHVDGFSAEVAWVTHKTEENNKNPDNNFNIAIRPTSETVMYSSYSKWIRSYRDLPLLLNQWCNIVRWEFKCPTPFIRSREFLWQEGHCAFANQIEAENNVFTILEEYRKIYEELLCVPVVKGTKTELEKFAGGVFTTSVEAFIPGCGRAVQAATSHFLGQNFSKMFNIQYESVGRNFEYVWQTSWGITTRSIGIAVMIHSDDQGLVLPPFVSPTQVVVIPIYDKKKKKKDEEIVSSEVINAKCNEVYQLLLDNNIRCEVDLRDHYTAGFKYNYWELKGANIRIEIGPRDVKNNNVMCVRRDIPRSADNYKTVVSVDKIAGEIKNLLVDISKSMFNKAKTDFDSHLKKVTDFNQMVIEINNNNFTLVPFCLEKECEEEIKKKTKNVNNDLESKNDESNVLSVAAKSLNIPDQQDPLTNDKGIIPNCIGGCGKVAKKWVLFGRSY